MRIVMLAQWYPPILGGEELHVRNLSAALVARGHEVTVVTLRQEGLEPEELDGQVRVVRLDGTLQQIPGLFSDAQRRSAAPLPEPGLTLGIDRVAREANAEVLHAHNWLVHAALPVRAARRIPLVQTLHDFSQVCAVKVLLRRGESCSGPGLAKCLDCSAAHYGPLKGPATTLWNWTSGIAQRRLVDRFIAVSRAIAEGNNLDGLPHTVIPNFVLDSVATRDDLAPPDDGAAPNEVAEHLATLPSGPFFLFAGALGRLKGVHLLLEAYRREGADLPPLVLVGYRTRESDDLLRDVPPNVRLLGEWPHAAVRAAWPLALAGLVPSICQEACPTVVIEAMQAGRPVIASASGGTLDLVEDGVTGLLVRPGDPGALVGALRRLASEPGLAAALGAAAADRAPRYSASTVVPQIEAVYREVALGRSPGAGQATREAA